MRVQKGWIIGLLAMVLMLSCTISAFLAGAAVGGLIGGAIGYSAAERQALTAPTPLPRQELPWQEQPPPERPDFEVRLAARVVGVVPDSPVDEAGVLPGDTILAVDDQELSPTHDLGDIIRNYKPGDRVRLTILRAGREQHILVRLGRQRADDGKVVAYLGLTYRLEPVRLPR